MVSIVISNLFSSMFCFYCCVFLATIFQEVILKSIFDHWMSLNNLISRNISWHFFTHCSLKFNISCIISLKTRLKNSLAIASLANIIFLSSSRFMGWNSMTVFTITSFLNKDLTKFRMNINKMLKLLHYPVLSRRI